MALWLLVVLGRGLAGDEEEGPGPGQARERVARALEDLSSAEFAVRERARKDLERWGSLARDLLEARRDDPDAEVRRTVGVLLERLGGAQPAEAPPPPGDLTAIGTVTLEAHGPLAEVLGRIGTPHGATFVLPDGRGEEPVTVALARLPFFRAVDTVARTVGLAAPEGFDAQARLVLRRADAALEVPWDAVGPFRVRVVEVTSVRTLGAASGMRYALGIDLDWTPTVQVVTWSTPRDLEAEDADGHALRLGSATAVNTSWGVGTWATSGRLVLHVEPAAEEAAGPLARLAFRVPVRVRRERSEVAFERPTEDLPREARPSSGDARRVVLKALRRPEGEQGPWVADVAVQLPGETALRSVEVWLLRPDGTAQLAGVGSRIGAADGWLSLTARAWGAWDEPPTGVRVTWFEVEEQGEVRFTLADVPLR